MSDNGKEVLLDIRGMEVHFETRRGIARAVSVFVIDPVSLMVFVLSESSRLSERIDPDRQRLLPFFCLQGRQQPLFVAAA